MLSLWGDGWFYVSGGGFLVSCLLFVFLLGQYRAAIEAEEEAEEPVPADGPAEKVYIPRPIEPIVPIAHHPMPSVEPVAAVAPVMKTAPSPAAEPAPAPLPEKPEKKKDATTTGGLSPAVVYLQSLKAQIDHLDKELELLRGLASQQSAQGELILNRLSEVGQRLGALETAPAPGACEPAPAPEPEPVVVSEENSTVVLQPPPSESQAVPASEPEPAPEPEPQPETAAAAAEPVAETTQPTSAETSAEPQSEAKPARKGPVWPI